MNLPPPPWIVAHRGAEPLLENTLPSLQLAVAEGADLLEFDVQATADGALVLHHDVTLERLAGRHDLEVETATLAELRAVGLRPPSSPPEDRPGELRIPTLGEVFAALPAGFPVNAELKRSRIAAGRLAELTLAALCGRENVVVSSFDLGLLGELRRRSDAIRLAPLAHRLSPAVERAARALAAWSVHVARVSARASAAWQGPPLLVYTVNEPRRARTLFARGVAGVFTDRPGRLRAELGAPGDSGVLSRTYRGTRAP